VAQFTVTPVGPAWCTVSVTDKKGNVAVAGVHVVLARIAFVSNPDGLYHQVYVMDPDGQHLTLLTTDHTDKGQPAWSPDRTRIAFMSQGSTPTDVGEIWVMDADGRTRPASPSTVRPTATLPGHLTG
jgi:Tol biopolymer transport system component